MHQPDALAQFLDDPSALFENAPKSRATASPAADLGGPCLEGSTEPPGLTAASSSQSAAPPEGLLASRIKANQVLAARLDAMGNHIAARALRDCQRIMTLYLCDSCKAHWHAPINCGHRFCAVCQPKRAKRVSYFALQLFARAVEPRWMTLTMRRAPTLDIALTNLRLAWRQWRAIPRVRKILHGGFYQIEIKPKTDGWHVHIHALIDGHYFPKSVLWATWAKALHQASASVQINRCTGRQIVQYVTKYCSKPGEFESWTDEQLAAYARATYHRRLTGTWGTWYNKTLADLLDEWGPRLFLCPECHKPHTAYPARAGPRIWGEVWPWYRDYYWPNLLTNIENPTWIDQTEAAQFKTAIEEEF